MADVYLIHWRAGDELDERAERLRRAGHTVRCGHEEGGKPVREIRAKPPAVVVIDLSRLPSHGRHTAIALREQKCTRDLPLVFVDGDPEKVARVQRDLPDATYTSWRGIRGAITKAMKARPEDPVVPRTSAGYSGTPLPRKLGIKPGHRLTLLGAPDDFEQTLGALPDDVSTRTRNQGASDVTVLFVRRAADLDRKLPTAVQNLAEGGGLWIAWPKKASGVATDLGDAVVRRTGLATGLVDNKVCAIDATWSGLRFQRRRAQARGSKRS